MRMDFGNFEILKYLRKQKMKNVIAEGGRI